MYAMARVARGGGKAEPITLQQVKTTIGNAAQRLKSVAGDFAEGYRANSRGINFTSGGMQNALEGIEGGIRNVLSVRRSLLDDIVEDANRVAANGGEITVEQRMTLKQNLPVAQRRSATANRVMRAEFDRTQNYLIRQWEQNTGRSWAADAATGRRATPHHIIPLESGGANKWWNLVPTFGEIPNHSLPGIP